MTNERGTTVSIRIDFSPVSACHLELGPIRPPSEGQDRSLLIRVNRNCPWNRCLFCNTYKGKRFEYRSLGEVKGDIDVARAIAGGLERASRSLGYGGAITDEVIGAVIRGMPEVYGQEAADRETLILRYQSLSIVGNWLNSGARTVFLQDANAIIMRQRELVEVIKHLKSAFPTIERVTSYARSRTVNHHSMDDMRELGTAGLSRLHIGMESGCDEVLAFMDKGVTGDQHIDAGKKVTAAGISLSEYYMPGLGGREWSVKHALDSARVLSEIDGDFIRLRSLIVRGGSDLYGRMVGGEFGALSEDEMVAEIELFVENLNCHSYLASDQMSNLLWEVEGQLPQDKDRVLSIIRSYRSMPPIERMSFRLKRRAQSFVAVHGGFPPELARIVEEAKEAIVAEAPDAEAKTNRAIAGLKQQFV
ncbi:MAG: radical SAM protein [Dehalococcoidia bacterium]|nr:radical SAM protein [Dehalococcoidia bacterium]